jgi:hypothetical protein
MGIFDRIKKAFFSPSPSSPERATESEQAPASERAATDSGAATTDADEGRDEHEGSPPEPADKAIPTEQDLVQKITRWKLRPSAFQALWDGDTQGWWLRLDVVHRVAGRHTDRALASLRFGGDFRLFSGEVPPWPEAEVGAKLGHALAGHYGVPFFFPSPEGPEDECPNWWEQDRAAPCEDCGKRILPTHSPYRPKVVCRRCQRKREADQALREDAPSSPGSVSIRIGQGDRFELLYVGSPEGAVITRFALHDLGRDAEARDTGQIILEGDDLGPVEAHIDAGIKALLLDFKPDTTWTPPPESVRTATYEGRTLELEIVFDTKAREICLLIASLGNVRRAMKEHLRIWLVFRRGMTSRGAHVLRTLKRHDAMATVEQIVKEFQNVVDEESVRATLQQLEQLGHVRRSGEEVHLTLLGKYV